MIHRVKLYARINDGGNFRRVPVPFHKNGRAIKPEGHITGYLVRKAGKFEHVGQDLDSALSRLRQEEALLSGDVVPVVQSSPVGQRIRLSDVITEYKHEIRTLDKSKATIVAYSNALDDLLASCKKTFIDEIDRKDILAYMTWIRENLMERVPGGRNRTIRNRLVYLNTFFNRYGIKLLKERTAGPHAPGLLFSSDRPKVLKKKPKKYDQATIDKLIGAADVDQKDYVMFLLWSGFRDEETQYLLYSDFDWRNSTVTVHVKPQFGWKPKDSEERTITLPGEVSKMMKFRMDRPQQYSDGYRKPGNNDLVFPNGDGGPDFHLLRRLHAVAKKAGLTLEGRWAGHMFRKTAGSRVAKRFGIPAAMEFLGHSNIQTTALYLAADDLGSKKSRQAFDKMYVEGD